MAAIGGSTHGVTDDEFAWIDAGILTLVDLLEAKGISWGEYQEDMPYSGFDGDWVNQANGRNDYMRKHKYVFCPFILFA